MQRSAPNLKVYAGVALLTLGTACADGTTTGVADPEPPRSAAAAAGELASTMGFRKAVTVDAIRTHQAALQAIADAHGDRSVPGTGHAASAEYVRQQLVAAGYQVTVQSFPVSFTGDRTVPEFARVAPAPRTYAHVTDFRSFTNSGNGDVTAMLVAVDLTIPAELGSFSTSGCEAADFAGFPAGAVALMQRGLCTFETKVQNATAAGAVGAVIFNSGQPHQPGVVVGTLGPVQLAIPTVGTSYAIGVELSGGILNGATGATVRVRVDYGVTNTTSSNVIAELPLGDPDDVIVVGAPLDSRAGDAGINASSGAMAMLEIARVFAAQERQSRNRMRFVWFGASQLGNFGALAYVGSLSPAEQSSIRAMVHLDRIGSPNFVRFVESGAAPGSAEVAGLFSSYFDGMSLASAVEALPIASPGDPFSDAGIPTAGLSSGATGLKTPEQQAVYGGVSGQQYDPCTLGTCDTFANVSLSSLDVMSDAAAHVVLLLSKRNLARQPL